MLGTPFAKREELMSQEYLDVVKDKDCRIHVEFYYCKMRA